MPLTIGDHLGGTVYLAAVLAACALTGHWLVTRRIPGLAGLVRHLAVFLAGSATLVVALLLPAASGLLSRGAVLVIALAAAAVARAVPASAAARVSARPADPRRTWLQVAGGGVAAGGALAFLLGRADEPVVAVDALTSHLPQVARMIQTDGLWDLVQYSPELSNATYPQNGTLMLLAAVLPWDSTFAARFVGAPFLLAMGLAVYASAREIGAPGTTAVLAAAAVAVMPGVAWPALDQAQVDPQMLAWFALGSLFALRAARSGSRAEMALAGCGLGLAFGTKWYGVAYVPVVLAVMAVAGPASRRMLRTVVPLVALFGGFWLVRNWILTGNPVHPADVSLLGLTIFDAPPDRLRDYAGFNVAHYLLDLRIWREYLVPAYGINFGLAGPVLLVLGAVAAWAVVRGRRSRATAVLACSLAMGALYVVLPDTAFGPEGRPVLASANARYLVPALLGGALLVAWLPAALPRARELVEVLLAAAVLHGVIESFGDVGVVAAAVAVAIVALVVSVARAPRSVRRAGVVAAVAAVAAVAVVLDPRPYATVDPVAGWLETNLPSGARIGIAGVWSPGAMPPVLPAHGPRLGNRVDYLGRFVDGTLQAWLERDAFERQLRGRGYDAVVVGRGIASRPGGEEPFAGWVREAGYHERMRSPHLVLFVSGDA